MNLPNPIPGISLDNAYLSKDFLVKKLFACSDGTVYPMFFTPIDASDYLVYITSVSVYNGIEAVYGLGIVKKDDHVESDGKVFVGPLREIMDLDGARRTLREYASKMGIDPDIFINHEGLFLSA